MIEAMKQAKKELEHIKQYDYAQDIDHAIKTLGQAIVEAQKPEPVSWVETNDLVCALLKQAHDVLACASYPFKRPWVGLTDEEIEIYGNQFNGVRLVKGIEALLKRRNT